VVAPPEMVRPVVVAPAPMVEDAYAASPPFALMTLATLRTPVIVVEPVTAKSVVVALSAVKF
jgi:hypothetical protein